jgi:hypothetical protein
MRFAPVLIGLALLGGCYREDPEAAPSEAQVAMVEQQLAGHPCVGDLKDWERYYRFAPATGMSAYTTRSDLDVIEFHLRRAGTFTIEPGVRVLRRGETDDWPDGRNVYFIDGRFKIVGNGLVMPGCRAVRK